MAGVRDRKWISFRTLNANAFMCVCVLDGRMELNPLPPLHGFVCPFPFFFCMCVCVCALKLLFSSSVDPLEL